MAGKQTKPNKQNQNPLKTQSESKTHIFQITVSSNYENNFNRID